MNLCQKFGRLLRNGGVYLSVRPDASNLSTTTALLYSAPAPAGAPVRLPSGFNAPPPFALFIKERLTGKTGGVTNMKIEKENWKNLSDNEKENYVANAKKVRDEKRHNFEKLPEYQQRELIEQHEHKTAKLRRLRKKKSLHKLHADTNRPKHPLVSYMVFAKTRYEEHTNTIQTRDERINFAKETGEQWRRMTELEKQPYVDQARSNLAAYHQQIEEWEQKYANEIQEWRKANEPKKKTVAKGSKRTKKAAASKVELKKKLKEAEEKSSLGGDKKKGRSSTTSSSTTTANKKGDGGGETTDSKKKKTTPAPKKVKKADVKEAVD